MSKKIKVTEEFEKFLQTQLTVRDWLRQNPGQEIPTPLKWLLVASERAYEERQRTPPQD